MSSDDYARHMTQKYRLAISIAILNTKPENLSIDEYIDHIKNIVNENNIDDDLNVSVCSDDFNNDSTDEIDDCNYRPSQPKDLLNRNGSYSNNDNETVLNVTIDNNENQSNDTLFNDKDAKGFVKRKLNDEKSKVTDSGNGRDLNSFDSVSNDTETRDNINKIQDNDNIMFNDRVIKGLQNGNVTDKTKMTDSNNIQGSDHEKQGDRQFNTNKKLVNDNDNASVTILHNFKEAADINKERDRDINKERREKFREVIQVLKGVDVITTDKILNESQRVFCDSLQNKPFDPDIDLTQCYNDDYSTLIESIDKLTNVDKRGYKENYIQDNFKLNQRDVQVTVPKLHNNASQNNTNEIKKMLKKRMSDNEKNNVAKPKKAKNVSNIDCNKPNAKKVTQNTKAIVNDNPNIARNNKLEGASNKDQSQTAVRANEVVGTQETQYTKNTHYSASQINNVVIDKKLIYGINDAKKELSKSQNVLQRDTQIGATVIIDTENDLACLLNTQTNAQPDRESQARENSIGNDTVFSIDYSLETQTFGNKSELPARFENGPKNNRAFSLDFSLETQKNANKVIIDQVRFENAMKNDTAFSLDTQNDTNAAQTQTSKENDYINDDTQTTQSFETYNKLSQSVNVNEKLAQSVKTNEKLPQSVISNEKLSQSGVANDKQNDVDKNSDDNGCTVLDKTTNSGWNMDGVETEAEKIPFKIIEEMNRIKMYLKRNVNENSNIRTSQSKITFASTQQSWIGESANSLFNYLTSCPLVTASQLLTAQISVVLGKLIDRLHEDETYPPFLEELLSIVSNYLELLYNKDNYVFDVLQIKDELVQRILLLNKSTHIQKFTINKINDILQKLLDETSADATYEISNITKLENLNYIFLILQVILPIYCKNSVIITKTPKYEKVLRKNDITELWRKKWFENIKNKSNEGSIEKCVLKECSEILNKIIIDFMDGSSLIAYSALKCFNIMQS